ncbi:MAG: Do family serine endopeptidase [Sphingomonas sp.]|uniref:Probable periplasmic serine endoprotease DegP-like n=1 Tax=Sphingomonas adhaesiva TaxID=28212 RepID=A0A2A4I7R8_9SPHN|nr:MULTISPECIES: Do family serine endopeptidase [Sphingomonas]PCG14178.1 protease [Sphingomonas adhaesiva]PZU81157.1 MAG: Do family serine endopeptidase [Sphingomonas sp.]
MRYAYALTGALLLGGTAASLTLQNPATAQVAQNEPGSIAAAAPRAGAPMSFADLVAKLQPAVVNISTTQKVTVQQQANPFAGTPFGDLFGQFGGGGGGAPVTREGQSLGSGFLISADGYVVTNNHVIAPAARGATVESITVTLQDRKEYKAKLIGRDPTSDLAVLKIDSPTPLPFVRMGDSGRARVGDWVVAIGQPFGLGGTVTAGIVSAVHRSTGNGPFDSFIQTDAAINQGNSGGPMFNLNGEVIGINSQIYSQSGGNIGIGFAIPATEAKPIIDTLMKGQKIQRGYLGVGIQPVNDDIAAALGLPKNKGEIIGRVEPGGPGAKAGLRQGDVVTAINGQAVTPDRTLSYLVANAAPGSTIRMDVIRDGRPTTVTATVATRPPEDQMAALQGGGSDDDGLPGGDDDGAVAPASSSIGVTVQPLTAQIARAIGVDSTVQGVVVSAVDPSSDAGQKLKRGDVISSINSQPVRTAADVARVVAAAKAQGRPQVLLNITRQRTSGVFLAVKIK